MTEHCWELTPPVELISTSIIKAIVTKKLSDFWQINHVAVVQTVVVLLVLVEYVRSKVKNLKTRHLIVLVVTKQHAQEIDLATPNST